jgi:hypothetical protein
MVKVVINEDFGGFGLSDDAEALYKERKGITDPDWWYGDISRDDSLLIQIVEDMGAKADGTFAALKVVEVPDDVNWYIEEYDGREWVAERHRTWR